MTVAVKRSEGSHRLDGTWAGTASANAFLSHLEARRFSPATVRAYAFDIVCLARFLEDRGIGLGDLVPTDVFDWIDWQSLPRRRDGKVVIETTAARVIRLGDVDVAHALGEGEGYTSVAEWRAGHERFWHSAEMREALGDPEFTVDDDTLVVAQAFRLVAR